ncbi:MAG: recombination protein RecR [Chthoniobacterales bacterium]|nr:recombination protein RecR [Chthoniobacterales bacterium]
MKSADYPEPFRALVRELRRLPGVGPRSAERLALWLMEDGERPSALSAALTSARDGVRHCAECGFFCLGEHCDICIDGAREPLLCVVERATDILPIERSGAFRGRYHALGGRLSPLEHVGPEDLRLGELTTRLERGHFTEVILALSTDVEGEATTSYVVEMLAPYGVNISRLAQGMPAGGGLESADELTLARALAGRRQAGVV